MKKTICLFLLVIITSTGFSQDRLLWVNSQGPDNRIMQSDSAGGNISQLFQPAVSSVTSIDLDINRGRIYWADRNLNSVQSANLDGTDITTLFDESDSLLSNISISLDLANDYLYVAESYENRVIRSNLDGSDKFILPTVIFRPLAAIATDTVNNALYISGTGKISKIDLSNFQITALVDSGLSSIRGIFPDLQNNKLYWTNSYNNNVDDKIQRADLDGSNIETLVSNANGLLAPGEIQLDLDQQKMYWTDINANEIKRANLDGSNIETILDGATDNLIRPSNLFYHPQSQKIYYTESLRSIYSYDIVQADIDTLFTHGFNNPIMLFFNPNDNYLYLADSGPDVISRVQPDGTALEHLHDIRYPPSSVTVDTMHSKLYWTVPWYSTMYQSNLDGSNTQEILVSPLGKGPRKMAISYNLEKIYWTDSDNRIARANLDGSNIELIHDDAIRGGFIYQVAISDNTDKLFWTDNNPDQIYFSNLDGTMLDSILTGPDSQRDVTGIYVDDINQYLYWSDAGNDQILRSNLDGSGIQVVIAEGISNPESIIAISDFMTTISTLPNQNPIENFQLKNYPNPFNPATSISFRLWQPGTVTLKIYDVSGKEIRTLLKETAHLPGSYITQWDGRDDSGNKVASGLYLYRLDSGNVQQSSKMLLIR